VPPHRRRPVPTSGQTPPVRRPKVAGRRNRPIHEEPPVAPESVEPAEPVESDEVEEPDTEQRGSGVLTGVLGEPPARDEPVTESDEQATEPEPAPRPRQKADATTSVTPRPAGKRRTAGSARPTDLAAAEKGAGTQAKRAGRHVRVDDDRPTRSPAQRQLSVAIVLAVVAVILGGLAVFFRGEVDNLTSADSNSALTDSAGTSQVVGQVSDAIKKTFSYNYTDLDATEKVVKQVLSGKALCEYNLLFSELKQYAPQQKIILATTVREIGVVRLEGDRAEALVYIDQQSTRADVNKTAYVGGQFAVQAQRVDNRWKITKFDMFGQALFNGKPAPTC
jgi:Mce-associated membrane protein